MKAIKMFFAAAVAVAMVACGSDKKGSSSSDSEGEKKDSTENVEKKAGEEAAPTGIDGQLAQLDKLVDEFIPLISKAATGDQSVQGQIEQVGNQIEQLGRALDGQEEQMTDQQKEKFMAIGEKLQRAMMGGMGITEEMTSEEDTDNGMDMEEVSIDEYDF